jgi:small-conductance mechanosensitive channel
MASGEEIRFAIYSLTGYLTPQYAGMLAIAIAVFLGTYASLYILLTLVSSVARRLGNGSRNGFASELLPELMKPVYLVSLVLSVYAAVAYAFPGAEAFGVRLSLLALVAFVLSAGAAAAAAADAAIGWYGRRLTMLPGGRKNADELFPILRKLAAIAVLFATLSLILGMMGVEIAPLLAGLGIAGLAVALALQDTLSNFFAGIYLLADKPVRIGDMVKLADGSEGVVTEIGWRSTRITVMGSNDLIIPNAQLAQEKITNYSTPLPKVLVKVAVGVSYSEDPDKVEAALARIASGVIASSAGASRTDKPIVRIESLGDFAINYTVIFFAEEFSYSWPLKHKMHKEILKEFKKEKIGIPFPTHTVYVARGEGVS